MPSAEHAAQQKYVTRVLVTLVGLAAIAQTIAWMRGFLHDYEGPWWMRLLVLLLPWLVSGLYLLVYRRVWRPDELEAIIAHRTLAFAFNGMVFGIVAIDQLQMARLIPVFEWTNMRLLMTMIGLLVAGIVWTKRCFR